MAADGGRTGEVAAEGDSEAPEAGREAGDHREQHERGQHQEDEREEQPHRDPPGVAPPPGAAAPCAPRRPGGRAPDRPGRRDDRTRASASATGRSAGVARAASSSAASKLTPSAHARSTAASGAAIGARRPLRRDLDREVGRASRAHRDARGDRARPGARGRGRRRRLVSAAGSRTSARPDRPSRAVSPRDRATTSAAYARQHDDRRSRGRGGARASPRVCTGTTRSRAPCDRSCREDAPHAARAPRTTPSTASSRRPQDAADPERRRAPPGRGRRTRQTRPTPVSISVVTARGSTIAENAR